MLFLDANAFYTYYGRTKLGWDETSVANVLKLRGYLDQMGDKSLPASVFMEVVVHFRDDPSKIRDLLNFRLKKGLPIYNNFKDYCITDDEITSVYMMDYASLKNYAYNLLEKKIEIESKLALLFYEIAKDLYLEYRLSAYSFFTEKEEYGIWNWLGRKAFADCNESITQDFKNALRAGYDIGKDANVIKEKYIERLNEACQIIDVTLAGCKGCIEGEEDLIAIIQQEFSLIKSKGFDGQGGTMKGIVTEIENDSQFLSYAKGKIASIFAKHYLTKSQALYLQDIMFTAWFEKGQKLRKNDIFDMFCASCLDHVRPAKEGESILTDRRSKVITFDTTFECFLEQHRKDNYDLIQKLKIT